MSTTTSKASRGQNTSYDPLPNLQHLDPRLRALAAVNARERIHLTQKDLFIEHDVSRYLSDQLDALMCEPRHTRMPCLLMTGDAGMGKTAQLHRFQRRYPDSVGEDGGRLRPIVIANMPPEPTRTTLEFALLEALDAPGFSRNQSVDRAGVIRRMLTAHRTRGLVIDEAQHLCHSRARDRAVVLDTLKALSTTCQINILCAGTPAVIREFQADPQLERRFSITQLPQWDAGPSFQRFLQTYERARPLRHASGLAESGMVRAILAEAGGTTHHIVQCLNAAAIVAIHEGIERITPDLLTVYRTDPRRILAAKRAADIDVDKATPDCPRMGGLSNVQETSA